MESISTEALMESINTTYQVQLESISTEALMESINSSNQVAMESIGREYLMEWMRREASLEWTSKKATRKLSEVIKEIAKRVSNLLNVELSSVNKDFVDKTAIKELPTSIERLSGLIVLSLNHCTNLVSLPTVICSLRSLKALYLSGCSRLYQFPENLGDLECLQELDASETATKKIPSSILLMKNLEHLSFRGCKGVTPRLWRSLFCCCLSPEERSESTTFLQPPESLSGLISLRTLDLSSCNLPDGAIPVDIGRLSSLESLDLSENNFTTLPDSICELSQLRELRLNRCGNLKSLPALPSSIKYVHVHECASLETPSNDHEKQTSSNEGFSTTNCQGPDDSSKLELMDQVPVSDEYIQPLVRKYFEGDIYQRSMYDYIFWQERIPDWWSENSSTGSCTAIQLPSDFASDSCWLGFALCFLYLQEGDDKSNRSNRCLVELLCHFVTDEGELAQPLALPVVLDYNCPIYGACKFIPREWFGRRLDNASRIRVSVSSGIPSVKVKLCLSWLVSEHNVADFVGNEISELDVDTVAEEGWFLKQVVEFKLSDQADQSSVSLHLFLLPRREGAWSTSESSTNDQSCSSDLTKQLRRRLQFVLARLFKVTPRP
ncbi:hypothetical protein TIFTF001_008396 [Ficus carica]|uniref:Disease resistance protein RPS4B/Roq1-like leucine-rich repeats domain-containing protein n=1 Tax=Ficus carica TaxID=3494 RepID=A0AA87ZT77_FICCA|nr:hypothetical protein TIFTF001_008396 [Ficus carica]